MKKIFIFFLFNIYFSVCRSQTITDSCQKVDIYNFSEPSYDSGIQHIDSIEKIKIYDSSSHSIAVDTSVLDKKTLQNMENKKEKFFNKKRIVILTSLVALQVAFGFDPKFTAINLIWLLF